MKGKFCILMVLVLMVLIIPLGAIGEHISTFDVWYGNIHFWTEPTRGPEYMLLVEKENERDDSVLTQQVAQIREAENCIIFLSDDAKKYVCLVEVSWPDQKNIPEMHYVCDNSDCDSPAFYSGITEVGTYGPNDEYFYILTVTKKGVEVWRTLRTLNEKPSVLGKGGTEAGKFHEYVYSFSPKSKELNFASLNPAEMKVEKHKLLSEPHKSEGYLGWLEKGGLMYLTPAGELHTRKIDKGMEVVWFESCMVLKQGFFLAKVLPGEEPVSMSQQEFDQLMKSEALAVTDKP